jgi:large subunit ribosomal protein L4
MTQLTLPLIDLSKQSVGQEKVSIPFSLELQSPRSVAYVVRWQLAKKRSGSAKTKTMAEISGTTAKPYKQKGTGNARQGSKRSVQFVGGRTCHGPMPRSFDFSMPKKIVKVALADVIKAKLKEGKIVLISGDSQKTSAFSSSAKKGNISSALVISDKENITKSVRNIKNFKALNASTINAYDILSFEHLLVDNETFVGKILTLCS